MNDQLFIALIQQLEANRLELRAHAETFLAGREMTGYAQRQVHDWRNQASKVAMEAADRVASAQAKT